MLIQNTKHQCVPTSHEKAATVLIHETITYKCLLLQVD
jgi:hypothetical protein